MGSRLPRTRKRATEILLGLHKGTSSTLRSDLTHPVRSSSTPLPPTLFPRLSFYAHMVGASAIARMPFRASASSRLCKTQRQRDVSLKRSKAFATLKENVVGIREGNGQAEADHTHRASRRFHVKLFVEDDLLQHEGAWQVPSRAYGKGACSIFFDLLYSAFSD